MLLLSTTQTHELVCKKEFELESQESIKNLETFLRLQLFCVDGVVCSNLLSESYQAFKMACFRVLTSKKYDEVASIFLNDTWKLHLESGKIFVMKFESRVSTNTIHEEMRKRPHEQIASPELV